MSSKMYLSRTRVTARVGFVTPGLVRKASLYSPLYIGPIAAADISTIHAEDRVRTARTSMEGTKLIE